jgi:hypothetical protein
MAGKSEKDLYNCINDETGHQMGTIHPNLENLTNNPQGYQFGSLENGTTNSQDELQLNQQDMQNIVNSKEFKLKRD